MKIIQITDLHIGKPGEETFGVDVRGNFRRTLLKARELAPDHLVVTGDLCYRDGQRSIYEWVKEELDEAAIPYDIISGNHDDPRLLAETFGRKELLKDGELYFERQLKGRLLLFLDTTQGRVSQPQLAWLARRLAHRNEDPVLFMHHPPLAGGVPYMDNKYALKNQSEVQAIFRNCPYPVHVFVGHYHVDKIIRSGNLSVYITPSTFFQINQHHVDFQVDHRRPGFREIVIEEGVLKSTVVYLDGHEWS